MVFGLTLASVVGLWVKIEYWVPKLQWRKMINERKLGSILFRPPVFLRPPVTNYMLLYRTLLCKKIARASGGHKRFTLTKLGGGGGANRIDPKIAIFSVCAPSLVGAFYLQPQDARAMFFA